MTGLNDLSPEQRRVVESWGQGLAVMAGAGSGKTTTLVIKCAELLARNPEAKFAAVSFTERSASDLREKLSARVSLQGQGGALSGHWVMTIHGLCGAVIREYPREAGFDGEEQMLSEGESAVLWERALEALWFAELPPEVDEAVETLLQRESQKQLTDLLRRVRDLALQGVLPSLAESADPSARALEKVGRFALERYDRLKRRRGALDFSDLENGADRALSHAHVREAFQRKFDLVLIDEFQDTNPLQARILWRFARPDQSNLCVVGDPKQSIYRFRDADVSVFEECCARMPVSLSLTWNFRSRPGIIEFSNQVCAPAFEASSMRYDPLVPKREALPGLEPVTRLDVTDPSELANWIRGEMEKGVKLHEMALLLRKIRGNEKWLRALTAAGVPIAIGSGGLFWEDPRVRELTAFLKWWDNPANGFSGAVFLRAPWVAVADEDIDRWSRRDPSWMRPFFESGHPMAEALKPWLGKQARPGELLMALLINSEIEAELGAPLLGLWHRAEELSSRGMDFHSVVSELALACDDARRERDVPPPRNRGQLTVLTLHASKGLEFPHVILVDLPEKPPRALAPPLLYWDRERGAFLVPRDGEGDRANDNPEVIAWRRDEDQKALAESKRLFYVALTRARERLVLVCPTLPDTRAKRAGPESGRKSDTMSDLCKDFWRGWIDAAATDLPLAVAPPRNVSAILDDAPPARFEVARWQGKIAGLRPRHSVTEWTTLSRCPRAYEWTYVRPVVMAAGMPDLPLFTGEHVQKASETLLTQRELGTRVHACLEKGDYDGLKALEDEAGAARFLAEPVISWALASDWMKPAAPGDSGRDVWTEIAFEVPVSGEALVGSIDRLVRSGDRYSLIDFKVTEKPKSVEVLLEAYQTQLDLYSWAVSRLEPAARGRTQALLVNIAPRSIQAVEVPLTLPEGQVEEWASHAARIVAGDEGAPKVGPLCRMCEFRPRCPEGRRFSSAH